MSVLPDLPAAAAPPAQVDAPRRVCENCGAELKGEHCYACGQPTKGLVRHFGSILGDFADTVFNVDGRIFRTLGPLLVLPGYLSLEYFAGRRVRYVSPVRLFVFTCLIAFLVSKLSVDPSGGSAIQFDMDDIESAQTVAEVSERRDSALAELESAQEKLQQALPSATPPGVAAQGLQTARDEIEQRAQQRIAEIEAGEAKGEAPQAAEPKRPSINFNGKAWDAQANPLTVSWLPDAANVRLNQWVQQALDNSSRVSKDPRLLSDAFLDVLPQTLFILLPVFALLLKFAYLFKRRLYMEHLIVALHSHAFLSLALLLLALATLARDALGSGLVHSALGTFEVVLLVWMPIYLLIMQKRVYRQGWIMTVLKYGLLGTAYTLMISLAVTAALMVSLVAM